MSHVVAVAVSGGRDSMALLHCTARMAAPLGVQVVALHVHHGLMPQADAWADHVAEACVRWARRGLPVRFALRRLEGGPLRGDSVEAWARAGRYLALGAMAREAGASLVLLGHHRGDQAETFLLQALRGAGPAGLAAMPRSAQRDGLAWARPWLNMPRESVQAYARRHRIAHVEDPSNADERYARSRLRQGAVPALLAAFPDAESALAASALQAARAQDLLDEIGGEDLQRVCIGPALVLKSWAGLSPSRRRNALRCWLFRQGGQRAGAAWLDRLMDEVTAARGPAEWIADGVRVRRYRGRLTLEQGAVPRARGTPLAQSVDAPQRPLRYLDAITQETGGLPRALLEGAYWRPRRGDDRFQRAPRTPPRALKKQFQLAGVPLWERGEPVLVAADGRLLFVPGLGTDARALAEPGQPRVTLQWIGAPAEGGSGQ